MGKSRKLSTEDQEESKVVAQEELYESDLVRLKKENQRAMELATKDMTSQVKKNMSQKQVVSAVKALQKFFTAKAEGTKKNLLRDEDAYVHLTFTMQSVPVRPTPRPLQMSVPAPFNTEGHDTRACLIVKDPEEHFRSQISSLNIPCVAEVIGFDRLKRDFRQFQDKRQLLRDFDLFLADIRVYKMLPALLGKEFYQKKAYPCPIKVHDQKDLAATLNAATSSAYFTMGNGPNYSAKIGRISQDAKDIAKNSETVLS